MQDIKNIPREKIFELRKLRSVIRPTVLVPNRQVFSADGVGFDVPAEFVSENAIIKVHGLACSIEGVVASVINPKYVSNDRAALYYEASKRSLASAALHALGLNEARWYIKQAAGFIPGVLGMSITSLFVGAIETDYEHIVRGFAGPYVIRWHIHGKPNNG